MAYTDFCCRSGGSNLNAGTRTGNSTEPGTAAFKTYTSGTWVQSTRTFTPAGGANPTTDGIAVGDFVSVYPDAATVSPYVARITTVGATTFVTDATAKMGTAPVDGALVTSASIGGAWKGPNAAENFPFGFFTTNALTNVAGDCTRVNFKNDATYAITAVITATANFAGPFEWRGYTTSYADGGRATIDGSTNAINLVNLNLNGAVFADFIISNNGTTGSNYGLQYALATASIISRVSVNNVRGAGFIAAASAGVLIDCEAWKCNSSNTSSLAAFYSNTDGSVTLIRCIAHDNAGNVNSGFAFAGAQHLLVNCISDNNGLHGYAGINNGSSVPKLYGCEAYANAGSGFFCNTTTITPIFIESCNFVGNTLYGINLSGGKRLGYIRNCGFVDNGSGATNTLDNAVISGSVNYTTATTPWVDPANGDFRINNASAINAGYGTYMQTTTSPNAYAGTVGRPDIGASQHLESSSSSVIGVIGS